MIIIGSHARKYLSSVIVNVVATMSLRVEELVNIIVGSEKSNLEGLQEGIQPGIKRRYDERNRGDEGNDAEREKKRQLGRGWQHGGYGYARGCGKGRWITRIYVVLTTRLEIIDKKVNDPLAR